LRETKQNYKDSSPPWHIAVIVIAALLIAIGVPMAMFWCYKRKRASNTTHDDRGSLQNIQSQGSEIVNAQPNTQFADFNYDNPTQHQGPEFSLNPSSNHPQQNKQNPMLPNPTPRADNDGYVNPLYSPANEACEDPDAPLIVG
jgi:heme/copper-type cytochrome/quinol oxidase subunit 2